MRKRSLVAVPCTLVLLAALMSPGAGADEHDGPSFVNSLGMELVRIEPGTYQRGSTVGATYSGGGGIFDEVPVHEVTISQPFYMATTPVTNAQYEEFDPAHAGLRGKLGWSTGDDEAALFVSWHDAVAFTEWLSDEEGEPYRLATEAEWEYAARAGTTTEYWQGDVLPVAFRLNQNLSWFPGRTSGHSYVPLTVGQTPANPWGLHDVHGLVEEWVLDTYGPYEAGPQTDPVGRVDGDFKLARGGSHGTQLAYLRSAARMANPPGIRNWVTGFRVVKGEMPGTAPLPAPEPEPIFQGVSQDVPDDVAEGPDPDKPYFAGPRVFVNVDLADPRFGSHNHQPAISELPNGDLMAIWYTTRSESDRQLKQAGARLRYGNDEWDDASIFWNVPSRNDHGNDLWWDGDETLYHWTGLGVTQTWGALALVQRTSTDNGATWSSPRLIQPEQGLRNQVIAAGTRLSDGRLLLPADATTDGSGGTAVHISEDGGLTWTDPGTAVVGDPPITIQMHQATVPSFTTGNTGGWIAGIHAPVAELSDGRLMAFGRGNNISGTMPMSVSADGGQTWTYGPSQFNSIGSGQRAFLLNLDEGAIMFASFTTGAGIQITDAAGEPRQVVGLYTAVSFDDGATWPYRRLVTDDGPARTLQEGGSRGTFVMSPFTSERFGYLSATQARDGLIHLISSANHYTFNLEWLTSPPPVVCEGNVMFGDYDTGVAERNVDDATCIGDHIDDDAEWSNVGAFVSHVAQVTRTLRQQGIIDSDEREALIEAASASGIGRG